MSRTSFAVAAAAGENLKWLYATVLLLAVLAMSCNRTAGRADTGGAAVDTVRIAERAYSAECFLQEESDYPRFAGSDALARLNLAIEDSVLQFLAAARAATECADEAGAPIYMGWANTCFEVLSNNPELISVALYLTSGYGGGNAWEPSVLAFTLDRKSGELVPKQQLLAGLNRQLLNDMIYRYFLHRLPDYTADIEETIGKRFIEDEVALEELEFAIRNDSVCLLLPAYPAGHYSYGVYTIPVQQVQDL